MCFIAVSDELGSRLKVLGEVQCIIFFLLKWLGKNIPYTSDKYLYEECWVSRTRSVTLNGKCLDSKIMTFNKAFDKIL